MPSPSFCSTNYFTTFGEMALFNIIVKDDKEIKKLLKQINFKLDKLLEGGDDRIKKATADLDTSTNELKDAVDKNTPT